MSISQQEISPAVAQVGDKRFHEIDIDYEILSMPESMRYLMRDPVARAKVLDVMIKREAVAQKAREIGLNLDPLILYRMRQANNTILIQSIREWQRNDVAKPTLEAIKTYYNKHANDFIIPEQIHARHILLSDKQQALEVIKLLQTGTESFPTLAAQFSIDDGNKGRGGDLNWFSRGVMTGNFEQAAFALNEGNRLSKPIQTDFGWHVIEWLGKRDASTPTLEDVSEEIISIIEKEKLDDWVNTLMEQADIEVLRAEYYLQY